MTSYSNFPQSLPQISLPKAGQPITVSGVSDGVDVLLLAQLAKRHNGHLVHVSINDAAMAQMEIGLKAMGIAEDQIIRFPAWDCLPYDRVSPSSHLVGQRVRALSMLASNTAPNQGVILTTVNAWLQYVPVPEYFQKGSFQLSVGVSLKMPDFTTYAEANAYHRTNTVREPGEYAVRGGILDVFPPGSPMPVRIDLFGDEVETIKTFDPETQRSGEKINSITLYPVSEVPLDEDSISQFRRQYVDLFGGQASRDEFYQMVSSGRRGTGIEHHLPLFHEKLVPLIDYLKSPLIVFADETRAAIESRCEQIMDFYKARKDHADTKSVEDGMIRPVPVDQLYREAKAFDDEAQHHPCMHFNVFKSEINNDLQNIEIKSKKGILIYQDKDRYGGNAMAGLGDIITRKQADQTVLIAAASEGGLERIHTRLSEQLSPGTAIHEIAHWSDIMPKAINIMIWPLANGFVLPDMMVVTEQDIFGTRLTRPQGKRKRAEHFLREVSSLNEGDLVVHVDHGIGRYEKLETISIAGADHDCVLLIYAGGDKLYLPVENIDLLSRYGREGGEMALDKLGGAAWQAKKARIKGRIRDIAAQLIKVAAMRQTATTESYDVDSAIYSEFCQRFPYAETEDQQDAIQDTLADMRSGRVMDRLVCGDVGFGKTEVALRAAFVAAMSGYQVAVVTPTTLLARQHGKLFEDRFKGFGVSVGVLSRMTSTKEANEIKKGLVNGDCQIVIGTHALLSKTISFNNLGLMIVDEEQHFGVTQKERLKSLRGDIHVLTLTATPIPRTLQMALSGVRDMSIIATPPIDRLAIRTSVGPWDGVVLSEAIRRERHRGGQVFCVSPRIDYLSRIYDRLINMVPDARIITAHGQMPAADLDEAMNRFGDGEADILLATNIIESGIDIQSANTMIIHRADLFGLSQLYQLRGRIGRSKERAYAYLTTDPSRMLTPSSKRRLEVMQTLDSLGAGFTLASYDLDIRGAGNLLGDEQSGHVREVGVELYQAMLDEAVKEAKSGVDASAQDGEGAWSPVINLGASVLIPEDYVPDLSVRLSLYRRIAAMEHLDEQDQLAAELVDRFGPLPNEVQNLIDTIVIKIRCRLVRIEKLDAGPKGISVSFRDNRFPDPDALIKMISRKAGIMQVTGDQKLVMRQTLPQSQRVKAARDMVEELVSLVALP